MAHARLLFTLLLLVPALPASAQLTLAVGAEVAPPTVVAPTAAPLVVVQEPTPAPVYVTAPPSEPEHPELEGSVFVGLALEGIDTSDLRLTADAPEIRALEGLTLEPGWAGLGPDAQLFGSLAFGVGMRAHGYLRGPELRVFLGGGSADGPWTPAQGTDLELSMRGAFIARGELAVGLQLPLGPVTPYALLRAGVGGAWLSIDVRDERLGELGTESFHTLLADVGVDVGMDVEFGEGTTLGFVVRGNFLGAESFGGMMTLGFHGE